MQDWVKAIKFWFWLSLQMTLQPHCVLWAASKRSLSGSRWCCGNNNGLYENWVQLKTEINVTVLTNGSCRNQCKHHFSTEATQTVIGAVLAGGGQNCDLRHSPNAKWHMLSEKPDPLLVPASCAAGELPLPAALPCCSNGTPVQKH